MRKSINKALKVTKKRNADLWFPEQVRVEQRKNDFSEAILMGPRKGRHNQRLRHLKERIQRGWFN